MRRHRRASFFFLHPFLVSVFSRNRRDHRFVAFDEGVATVRPMDVHVFSAPFPDHVVRSHPRLKQMAHWNCFIRTCDYDLERVFGLREFDGGAQRGVWGKRHPQLLEETRDRDRGDARISHLSYFELRSLDRRPLGSQHGRHGVQEFRFVSNALEDRLVALHLVPAVYRNRPYPLFPSGLWTKVALAVPRHVVRGFLVHLGLSRFGLLHRPQRDVSSDLRHPRGFHRPDAMDLHVHCNPANRRRDRYGYRRTEQA